MASRIMKQTSAFTLVEVVIVIVIIGIISTIGVFSYSGVQSDSRDTQRSSRVSVISEALEKYYWQNGNYPSCEELTQDASVVSSDVLKGIDATVLATPSNPNGTNSIVCDNNSNNVDAFIYSTPTDGSEYTLSYIKESTKEVVPLASRYSKLIVNLGVSVISIDSVSDTQINISWSAVEGATEYKVERSTSSDFNSNLVETSTSDLSMSNTGLSVGTMYYFHVIPKSTNGMGSSVAKEATTTIPAPSSLAVTTSSSTSTTTWSWTTVTCSAGTTASYQYRYTTSSGYDSTWVTPTSPTATSISFTTSTEGVTYTLQVQQRCSTTQTNSTWGSIGSASYTRPVTAPIAAPTVTASTPSSTTTWSWTTATCSAGTTANFQYRYTTSSGYDSTWVTPTSPTATSISFTTSTEGVTYTLQVQQRCSTTQTNSTWGSIGSASYTRPVTLLNGTVNYGLSFSSSSGSYSVNIPGLVSITSVTTNNGGVSAYNSGTTAVFNVYSGSATTGSTTSTSNVSKVVNSTVGPQSSSYLPPTKSYNDGVYSGTLNRTNISSSLVSSSSKVVTYVNYSQGSLYHYEGQYYNYNVNGYVGSIPYVGFSGSGLDGAGNPIQYATYRGTVYKNVYNYTGTYSGTVYGQITTTNYYHYYYYYLTVNYKYR